MSDAKKNSAIWGLLVIGLIIAIIFIPKSQALFLIAVILALYFLPAIVAKCRNHANTMAIFIFNLFLGWTFLGWVLALVWACTANVLPRTPKVYLDNEWRHV